MVNNDDYMRYPCVVCGQPFIFGPHRYEGRPIKSWNDVMVCNRCEKSNWDGIVPRDDLLRRLKQAGVESPAFNDKGFIPIPR